MLRRVPRWRAWCGKRESFFHHRDTESQSKKKFLREFPVATLPRLTTRLKKIRAARAALGSAVNPKNQSILMLSTWKESPLTVPVAAT